MHNYVRCEILLKQAGQRFPQLAGLILFAAQMLCCGAAIAQSFAPPANVQKFPFYPQGGNFFGDLFPVNFVDLNPSSPGILVYNGSDYTYDGHNGCDTEILGFPAQAVGVPIFAALDGTVIAEHDGEFDMNTTRANQPDNTVTISHGNGQTTTYDHFKKNSITVRVGQTVIAGQQIGLTGSSGNSTAPHLHFQCDVNNVLYEPFAGVDRPGISGWVSQPPFQSNFYLREIVLTNQNLSTWQGYPYDTTRTGTFYTGVQSVGVWMLCGNAEGLRSLSANYVRPDGSVAFSSQTFSYPSGVARNAVLDFQYNVNLDTVGAWKLQILINGSVFTEAPFTVISTGSPIVNRPPGYIQATLDPITPSPSSVEFCRVISNTLYLDPDYALVSYHYVWKVNNVVVRDVVSAGKADAIPKGTIPAGASVTCTVTPSDGQLSGPSTTAAVLRNISTRLAVQTGNNVGIAGFVISGTGTKTVLVRALGPTLTSYGVPGALANPTLELHDGTGATIAANDNWATAANAQTIPPAYRPPNSLESAIYTSLAPGPYTAIIRGVNNTTGVGLVEVYDFDDATSSSLINISTRGVVQTGSNAMIGGFAIAGPSKTVIVRALGPTLSSYGVAGALADPTLELHNAQGSLLASNNNWQDTQAAQITATG
ncbi:MAG: M23 family metallopeptidase, partial [Verrucomicrobia bacterium]|nr:M23 family metallopeptidase [Verrucomicrobiota bacterium]